MSSSNENTQNPIPGLKIRVNNIPYQHQTDLMEKLKIAINPLFNDEAVARLVHIEIDKRKKEGSWDGHAHSEEPLLAPGPPR